eukprot:scaffold22589_cov138-Cylindrotheca_fusiformis.AAC.7
MPDMRILTAHLSSRNTIIDLRMDISPRFTPLAALLELFIGGALDLVIHCSLVIALLGGVTKFGITSTSQRKNDTSLSEWRSALRESKIFDT